MKQRHRKKRKNVYPHCDIQHTVVTLNPHYIEMPAERLDALLPPPPPFASLQGYCGWQEQKDSGDLFLFFRTRPAPKRHGIHIHHYLENPPSFYSPIVFAMVYEKETQDFERRFGYDVSWERILEIQWDDFSALMSKMLTELLAGLLQKPEVTGYDKVAFLGDAWWIPKPYQKTIQRAGKTYAKTGRKI